MHVSLRSNAARLSLSLCFSSDLDMRCLMPLPTVVAPMIQHKKTYLKVFYRMRQEKPSLQEQTLKVNINIFMVSWKLTWLIYLALLIGCKAQ